MLPSPYFFFSRTLKYIQLFCGRVAKLEKNLQSLPMDIGQTLRKLKDTYFPKMRWMHVCSGVEVHVSCVLFSSRQAPTFKISNATVHVTTVALNPLRRVRRQAVSSPDCYLDLLLNRYLSNSTKYIEKSLLH